MVRRTKAAIAAGQPASAEPTEYRGRNARGAVRPADDRYLEYAELDARDAYVLEVTGPQAQQLVAKREALRLLLDRLSDEQLAAITPEGFQGDRLALLDQAEGAATTMPNAEYRALLDSLQGAIHGDDDLVFHEDPADPAAPPQ